MPTTRSGITTGGDSADGKRKMKMDVDESKRKRHEKDANAASKAKAPSAAKVQVKSPSSSILEKGIIYFFVRARVTDADAPQQSDAPGSAAEVARAYMILRPLDVDSHNATARLLAVPKKTLPTRGGQRLIAFVEKAGADFSALRDEFLAGGERETKTRGTRHVPAATPVARGVYAITTTGGGESHLAYMLTLPRGGEGEEGGEEPALGEVQKSMGLRDRASWIISTRNPAFPPPERAVPQQPEYPKDLIDDFASYRWIGTLPRHLDFSGTQILLVGEKSGIDKATEPPEDATEHEMNPKEELMQLDSDDVKHMRHLAKDDSEAIFRDLEADASKYPGLKTSF